jgi:hypothetical protein
LWSKSEKYKISETSCDIKILYVFNMQNFTVAINPLFAVDNKSLKC